MDLDCALVLYKTAKSLKVLLLSFISDLIASHIAFDSSSSLPVEISEIFSPFHLVASNFFSALFLLLETTDQAPSRIR